MSKTVAVLAGDAEALGYVKKGATRIITHR
jgi:hypothetical protein